jgi:hypothetical protein
MSPRINPSACKSRPRSAWAGSAYKPEAVVTDAFSRVRAAGASRGIAVRGNQFTALVAGGRGAEGAQEGW